LPLVPHPTCAEKGTSVIMQILATLNKSVPLANTCQELVL